jgi:hypothetical protein
MSAAPGLNPKFPVVEGRIQISKQWHADLPEPMNRRVEPSAKGGPGQLVLWRPGLTAWLSLMGLPPGGRDAALTSARSVPSVKPDEISDFEWGNCKGFAWVVAEPRPGGKGTQFGLHAFLAGPSSMIQAAVYFDDADAADNAWDLLEGFDCE